MPRQLNRLSKRFAIVLLILLPIVGSACLIPPGSPAVVYPVNGPDPALSDSSFVTAEAYTTNSVSAHVPSYQVAIPPESQNPTTFDSLPTIPSQSYGNIWAPTVRAIKFNQSTSGWLMMFSEGITNRGNCIGAAKSNNGLNFVPINTWTFCSPTQSTGFLDPSLFIDPGGRVWLLYSQQWAPNGGSAIDAVQIDALGIFNGSQNCPFPAGDCGIVGEVGGIWSAYTLLNYGSVANINTNPGSSSFLENPSMTTDDYNGFDLTFSLGTWASNSTYDTGELPCGSPSSGCLPSCDGRVISGGGGASTASDGSPNGNVMIYDTWSGARRVDLAGTTTEANLNGSSCTRASAQALPAQMAQEHPVATPYHWPQRVVIPALGNVVIGETSPTSVYPSAPSTATTPLPAPVQPATLPPTPPTTNP